MGSVLGQAARVASPIDRSKISIPTAVRNTIGVAVTLFLGIVCGHPLLGVTASIGALNAGFASFHGSYRSRAEVVLAASVGLALSAFVGGTIGHLVGFDIVITALWGFAAGLLVALGQDATVVGLQSVIGLVVFSQFTFTPAVAAQEAGLLLAGGLLQTILIVVVWPLRRFPAERQALAGQLRAAVRTATVLAGGAPSALEETALIGRPKRDVVGLWPVIDFGWASDRLATPRAERLDLSSESCRHGMRLAATLVVAVGLSRALRLPHHYWLPLTVMIVLKPDFGATFTRGISRIIGTLVGAGLVTVALAELRPGRYELAVLVLVWCVVANLMLFANYAIYTVCISSLVVTLLAFVGEPELSIAAARSIYTVIGAALALIAYVVWPTWAATSMPDRLADLVVAEGRHEKALGSRRAGPSDRL